jgi:phenol 2-monooxygenase (NADPH)
VHYAPSAIVNDTYQSLVKNLIIGQRVPPQILLRAADGRPINIQDLIVSDSRYKVLVFSGSLRHELDNVTKQMEDSFLKRFVHRGDFKDMFEFITILAEKKATVKYTELPSLLKLHWSK